MRRIAIGVLLFVTGCSAEPRSASFFVANPEVADKVLADCQAGTHRGDECVNAHASVIDRERKARMETARRTFEGRR